MLPKEAIEEYKKIYLGHYRVKLNDEEAARRANNLITLYKAIYGSSHFGRVENERQENVNKRDN